MQKQSKNPINLFTHFFFQESKFDDKSAMVDDQGKKITDRTGFFLKK